MRGISVWVLSLALAVPAWAAPVTLPIDEATLIRSLIDALGDEDLDVRLNVATALARINELAIVPLIDALHDSDPHRRSGAAYTLALIGRPARAAMPALVKALKDPEVEVRRQAAYAIGRLLPSRVELAEAGKLADRSPLTAGAKP